MSESRDELAQLIDSRDVAQDTLAQCLAERDRLDAQIAALRQIKDGYEQRIKELKAQS